MALSLEVIDISYLWALCNKLSYMLFIFVLLFFRGCSAYGLHNTYIGIFELITQEDSSAQIAHVKFCSFSNLISNRPIGQGTNVTTQVFEVFQILV